MEIPTSAYFFHKNPSVGINFANQSEVTRRTQKRANNGLTRVYGRISFRPDNVNTLTPIKSPHQEILVPDQWSVPAK